MLLATYNGERYLGEQLDSLFAQTHHNIQLLVHDDNSSDGTVEVLKRYKNRYPDKITLLEDTYGAGSAVKNFAFLLAHRGNESDYVMFCDQDDVWLPTKIEETLKKMREAEHIEKNIPLLVYTDASVAAEGLHILADSLYAYQKSDCRNGNDIEALALENHILGCTIMMNSILADLVRQMPEEALMHDWWTALTALKQGGKTVFLDKPTLLYRQHGQNVYGASATGMKHYIRQLSHIRRYLAAFKAVIRQMKKIGIELPWWKIVYRKTAMVLRRVLHAGS